MKTNKPSIIVASNRGALVFDVKDGEIKASRGAGGLVTALSTAMQGYQNIWISAAISPGDKLIARDNLYDNIEGVDQDFHFVDIEKQEFNEYYNIISNRLLWFCYHYLWKLSYDPAVGPEDISAWQSYKKVNSLFADKIIEESQNIDQPLIFIHDYHLLLVAKYVREQAGNALISHFSHTAWPQPDYMAILPQNIVDDIFEGMLANDLLGFQSEKYRHNFLWCCSRLTEHTVDLESGIIFVGERAIKTGVYPISVDSDTVTRQAETDSVRNYRSALKEKFGDLKILLRIERADPTKNTLRGLQAYKRFLEKYSEQSGKVVYLCLLYASRTDIKEYIDYSEQVKTTAEAINEQFGKDGWEPVHLDVQDNYDRSLAALSLYDVLVVNSIYDGMNLIAKEGPLVNENNGVLVLSTNTGAFDEIGQYCLNVNPFSIEDTADTMLEALSMSADDRQRMQEALVKAVKANTAKVWLNDQIDDLTGRSETERHSSILSSSIESSTLSIK